MHQHKVIVIVTLSDGAVKKKVSVVVELLTRYSNIMGTSGLPDMYT